MNWFVINIYKYCKYINIYIYGGIAPIVNIEKKKKFEKLQTALLNVLKSCYNYTVSHLVTHTMAESENHKFSNAILHNHSILSRSDW